MNYIFLVSLLECAQVEWLFSSLSCLSQNQQLKYMAACTTILLSILVQQSWLVSLWQYMQFCCQSYDAVAGYICYDDVCHLRRFTNNPTQKDLIEQAKQLATTEMVVDRMHIKGHVDQWSKKNCDAEKCFHLDKVRPQTCSIFFRLSSPGIIYAIL